MNEFGFSFLLKQERKFGLESANNSFIAHALGLLPTLLDFLFALAL
jgi:hypothetical protein